MTTVEYRRLADVAKGTGVSWRQVDYWVRRGYQRHVRQVLITPHIAVAMCRFAFEPDVDEIRMQLAGRDLACWCPLDQPCHADLLLEVANR